MISHLKKFKGKILIPKIDNECQKDKLEEEVAMVKELQNIVYHLELENNMSLKN